MNALALTHLVVASIIIVSAVPLIKRKVRMNPWYGVRIPAAFASEERWYDINAYGGRLLLVFGVVFALTAGAGLALGKGCATAYYWTATAVVVIGLAAVIGLTLRYAAKGKSADGGKSTSR